MNKFTNKKYYIAFFLVVIITIGVLVYEIENIPIQKASPLAPLHNNGEGNSSFSSNLEKAGDEVSPKVGSETHFFLTLVAGNTNAQLAIIPNQTLYEVLSSKENSGKVSFSGKNYSGLGFFINDIGSLHAGGGKNLLYYINGKEASVGISAYTPKDGDIIEWKLE